KLPGLRIVMHRCARSLPPALPFRPSRRDLLPRPRDLQSEIQAREMKQLLLREGRGALARSAIVQRLVEVERSNQYRQRALVPEPGQGTGCKEPFVGNGRPQKFRERLSVALISAQRQGVQRRVPGFWF